MAAGGEQKQLWENVRREVQRYFTIDRMSQTESKQQNEWSRSRKEIQRIFCQDNSTITSKVEQPFILSILDEVKEELKEDAENFIVQQSRARYREIIQMGYFSIGSQDNLES